MSRAEPRLRASIASVFALLCGIGVVYGPRTAIGDSGTVDPLIGSAPIVGPAAGAWKSAEAGYEWEFPRDHFAHREYAIEWWYFTGHLQATDDPARRFAYQFTLFRIGLLSDAPALLSDWFAQGLIMGHAAITDPVSGEHLFSEVLVRETPMLGQFEDPGGERIAWMRGPVGTADPWELFLASEGQGFRFRMRDRVRGFGFELATRAEKPLVFQGPGGLSRKSDQPGAASLYYSFTRLATEGQVEFAGETHAVRGQSWMDKEISSSQLTDEQVGWDWFSLQLDDGRELMCFELRDARGRVTHARGTLVGRDGRPVYLSEKDWTLEVTRRWRSPESQIEYPAGWRLSLSDELRSSADGEWVIEPVTSDQENRSQLAGSPKYFEGAVEVRSPAGTRVGVGFVELTGYGEGNRPPL